MKEKKKVLVAVSGGVDSAVAAKLLKTKGYEVAGVFLHFWKEAGEVRENKCCSLEALNDAKRVCQEIGIPLYTFDFRADFKREVVDDFIEVYRQGRTPNPCVRCNRKIKIGKLLDISLAMGFDYVATGHYVKLKKKRGLYALYRAKDKNKDQSYFLYTFNQPDLKRLLFPLGSYSKPKVRRLAKKYSLKVAEKAESQEICFVPGKHHNDFLKKYLDLKPGKIKLLDGKVIGEHDGLPLYTIGQRRGINIGGTGPYYAASFDFENNDLFVVDKFDDPALYRKVMLIEEVNWASSEEPKMPLKCQVVFRYRHKAVKCLVEKSSEKGEYWVKFRRPQRALTWGQSAVFYQGDKVLGGGIIKLTPKA